MADEAQLTALGLGVTDTGAGLEAVLQLGAPLLNPLAQRPIPSGVFALAEDLLIPLEPPELVGLPPLSLAGVRSRSELEQQLAEAFHRHLVSLQRRSAELRALGLLAQVDPETLELSARLEDPPFRFLLAGDKRGQLRVAQGMLVGQAPVQDLGPPFELSEFPNRAGLSAYLRALLGGPEAAQPVAHAAASAVLSKAISYHELLARFGEEAWVPGGGAIDIVVTLRARGNEYRFAATRVGERTFRGLLAGPEGKVWADQFPLEDFPGVTSLAAKVLGITPEEVEVVAPQAEEG
jgi:hypothetical protein